MDLVFVKGDGSKHTGRDRYIVASCSDGFVLIKKLVGSQYRAREYKVKPSDLYHVPYDSVPPHAYGYCNANTDPYATYSSESEEESVCVVDQGGSDYQNNTDNDSSVDEEAGSYGSVNDSEQSSDGYESEESHVSHTASSSDNELAGPPNVVLPEQNRGSRQRRPPAWVQSGEWEVG